MHVSCAVFSYAMKRHIWNRVFLLFVFCSNLSIGILAANDEQETREKRTAQVPPNKDEFDLREIVDFVYRSDRWNGTWVSDSEYVYRNSDGDLALFSITNDESTSLVPSSVLDEPRVFRYWLSPDQLYVLLAYHPQKLFRHSFIALYDVYFIRTGERIKLQPDQSPLGPLEVKSAPNSERIQRPSEASPQLPLLYATWSPNGHSLAYIFSNNIYYRASPKSKDIQVSSSGIPGTIFNGIADWVYEEEVLSDTRAIWFSPNGAKIAWIEFNDTDVEVMPLVIYGQPGRLEFQYPIPTPLRYPKPGRTNPFVNVYVSDLVQRNFGAQGPTPILLPPPTYFAEREKIIYSVGWASEAEISLTWENRVQNYSVVSICDTDVAKCQDSLVLTEPNGWLELRQAPLFTKDARQFALIASSEGYRHVNIINRDTNQRIPITSGKMVVTKVYHWDEGNHLIYFRATRIGAPGERHLYTVTDFESGRPGVVKCLSCDVKNSRGGACGYNSFKFSKEKTYFTLTCEGPHVPQEYLFRAPLEKMATLVSNNYLSESLSRKYLPKISNLDVRVDGGRYVAKVRLYLPHDFDDSKKYPLLVNVYGGPNSQQVNDRFKLDWGTYLTTSEGMIYAVIDGRGSGYRGDDILFSVHRNIGNPEAQDQIDVTKNLSRCILLLTRQKLRYGVGHMEDF